MFKKWFGVLFSLFIIFTFSMCLSLGILVVNASEVENDYDAVNKISICPILFN